MYHRLQWFIQLWDECLRIWDKHPAYTLLRDMGTLYLYNSCLLQALCVLWSAFLYSAPFAVVCVQVDNDFDKLSLEVFVCGCTPCYFNVTTLFEQQKWKLLLTFCQPVGFHTVVSKLLWSVPAILALRFSKEWSIMMSTSVCVCVCLSVSEHISRSICPIFTIVFMHVTCCCGWSFSGGGVIY